MEGLDKREGWQALIEDLDEQRGFATCDPTASAGFVLFASC